MSLLSIILNILWIVTGGVWMAVGLADRGGDHGDHHHRHSLGACGLQHRELRLPALRAHRRRARPIQRQGGPRHRAFGTIGNLIWLILAGWWLALAHIVHRRPLAITIIGIPFAWAHLKLVPISLWPIGKMIVTTRKRNASPDFPLPPDFPSPLWGGVGVGVGVWKQRK